MHATQQLLKALACTFSVMRTNNPRESLHFYKVVILNSNEAVSCYGEEKLNFKTKRKNCSTRHYKM